MKYFNSEVFFKHFNSRVSSLSAEDLENLRSKVFEGSLCCYKLQNFSRKCFSCPYNAYGERCYSALLFDVLTISGGSSYEQKL